MHANNDDAVLELSEVVAVEAKSALRPCEDGGLCMEVVLHFPDHVANKMPTRILVTDGSLQRYLPLVVPSEAGSSEAPAAEKKSAK